MEKQNLKNENVEKLSAKTVTSGGKGASAALESSSEQDNKSKAKKAAPALDPLAKIREEERAKLEALKEREREKTRLAVEKERARLEAELAKEIAELESQLQKQKSASQKTREKSTANDTVINLRDSLNEPTKAKTSKPAKESIKTDVNAQEVAVGSNEVTEVVKKKASSPTKVTPSAKQKAAIEDVKTTKVASSVESTTSEVKSVKTKVKPENIQPIKVKAPKVEEVKQTTPVNQPVFAVDKDSIIEPINSVPVKTIDELTKPENAISQPLFENKVESINSNVDSIANIQPDQTNSKEQIALPIDEDASRLIESETPIKGFDNLHIEPNNENNVPTGNIQDQAFTESGMPTQAQLNLDETKSNDEIITLPNKVEPNIQTISEINQSIIENKEQLENNQPVLNNAIENSPLPTIQPVFEIKPEFVEPISNQDTINNINTVFDKESIVDTTAEDAISRSDELFKELLQKAKENKQLSIDEKSDVNSNSSNEGIVEPVVEPKIDQSIFGEKQVIDSMKPANESVKEEQLNDEKSMTLLEKKEEVVEELQNQPIFNKLDENEVKINSSSIENPIDKVNIVEAQENKHPIDDIIRETKPSISKLDNLFSKDILQSTNHENVIGNTVITHSSENKPDSRTVLNSLQKLREKIEAQKRLERELMEREVSRVHEKDKSLQEKFNNLGQFIYEEEDKYVTVDELEAEKRIVDELRAEKEELDSHITNLKDIINKVLTLKVNGINVINPNTFELTPEFIDLGIDSQSLSHTISEIEEELDLLSQSHENNIRKLIDAEDSYDELLEKYQQQLVLIEQLNKEIVILKEQVRKEKSRNEEVILQLEKMQNEKKVDNKNNVYNNHQLEGFVYSTRTENEVHEDDKYKIIGELDHLRDEVKNLISKNELHKTKELLNAKDQEIEVLRRQVEEQRNQKQDSNCPYFSCPSSMFMPRPYNYYPTEKFDNNYYEEISRLKFEIEQLKKKPVEPETNKLSDESIKLIKEYREELIRSREERKKFFDINKEIEQFNEQKKLELEKLKEIKDREIQKIAEIKNVEIAKINEQKKYEMEQLSQIKNREIAQVFETKNKEILQLAEVKNKEIEKISTTYQTQLKNKETENANLNQEKENNIKKIKELESKIKEKDQMLQKINQDLKRLSEEDILDPEFKKKIRNIRQKRKEILDRAKQEEDAFRANEKSIKEKIDEKKMEIDRVNDKIFQIEVNYKENRDFSSTTKDLFEKSKGKALMELQLYEGRLRELEEDLNRINSKYQQFLKTKDADLNKVNNEEVETVEFFINKMRQEFKSTDNYRKYKDAELERDDLVKKLDELKNEQDNLSNESQDDTPVNKEEVDQDINKLETDIKDLTREYNDYYRQLTDLKSELDKRVEFEKRIRSNEEDVYEYCTNKANLEDYLKDYQNKSELVETKKANLEQNSSTLDRTEQLKLKAEIQDLEIHRDDLRAKIDFYKKHLSDLEKKENVQSYNSLITQIEKIRSVQKEQRDKAESIKIDVQNKTKQLEKLKARINE